MDTKVDKDMDQSAGDDADSMDLQPSCYVRVVAIDRKEGLTDEAWQEAADKVLSEQPLLHGKSKLCPSVKVFFFFPKSNFLSEEQLSYTFCETSIFFSFAEILDL